MLRLHLKVLVANIERCLPNQKIAQDHRIIHRQIEAVIGMRITVCYHMEAVRAVALEVISEIIWEVGCQPMIMRHFSTIRFQAE